MRAAIAFIVIDWSKQPLSEHIAWWFMWALGFLFALPFMIGGLFLVGGLIFLIVAASEQRSEPPRYEAPYEPAPKPRPEPPPRSKPPPPRPPEKPNDHWQWLGLKPGASADEINAAYKRLAKRFHPDHGGTDAAMRELNIAKAAALAEISEH